MDDLGYPYFGNPHLCEEQWWKVKAACRIPGKVWSFFSMNKKNTSTMRWAVLHVRVLKIFFWIAFQVGRFGWNTCWSQQCGVGFVVSFFLQTSLLAPACCNWYKHKVVTNSVKQQHFEAQTTSNQRQSCKYNHNDQRSEMRHYHPPKTEYIKFMLYRFETRQSTKVKTNAITVMWPKLTQIEMCKKNESGFAINSVSIQPKSNPQCHPKHEI